jgi:hypothetical protein
MSGYNYYFLDLYGIFEIPNFGGGETAAAGEIDTEQELETVLPNFVDNVLNSPGEDATSWIGPNFVEGYFYGITQDLDYLNTVIGSGQQQVQYIWELPYYGQYAYDFVVNAEQAADDNTALAAIVSNVNFSTEFNAAAQDYVVTGVSGTFSGGDYKLYVEDSTASVAQYFETILANASSYGNFGYIFLQPDDPGYLIGAAFDTLILPFIALTEQQGTSNYTITTNYGTSLVVSLQVTDDGGSIPITISDYETYTAPADAAKGVLQGKPPLEISDTVANVNNLSLADISTFTANNVAQITAPGPLTFTIAQVLALVGAGVSLDNVSASVSDSAANIGSLTPAQIDELQQFGITRIAANDASVYLNAAQITELAQDNITVSAPSGSQVIFQDSDTNIASLNPSLLPGVGVTEIESTDLPGTTLFALPAAYVLTLASENIPAYYTDGATPLTVVSDTNADIGTGALTPAQIDTLGGYGIQTISSNQTLDFTAAQINEFYTDSIAVDAPAGSEVVLSDSVANIQAFITNVIQNGNLDELSTVGVDEVQSTDNPAVTPFTLTIQQGLTLAGENIPAEDANGNPATIADTASNIQGMSPGQVDALAGDGFTTFQNTSGAFEYPIYNTLALNAGLVVEIVLDGMTIVNPGQATIYYDSASYFNDNTMDSQVLSGMQAAGFTGILTNDNPVTIYVAQYTALPFSVRTEGTGLSTIADTADAIEQNMTVQQITDMPSLGFGFLDGYTALALSVAQILAVESANVVTQGPAPYSTAVTDTAANIETLTSSQLQGLVNIGVGQVNSTDAPLTFNADQVQGIVDSGAPQATVQILQVTALYGESSVTVEDSATNLINLFELNADDAGGIEIYGVAAAGINNVIVSSGEFDLEVDQAFLFFQVGTSLAAINDASLVIVDIAITIDALTVNQIDQLADAGFTEIESNSGELSFNVKQALALADSPITLSDPSPGTIAISDTAANLQTLSADDIEDLRATGFNLLAAQSGALALTLDQALAAVGEDADGNDPMSVSAPGGITVTDTSDDFASMALSDDDIAALHEAGFGGFVATNGPLYLSVDASLAIVDDKMTVSASDGNVVVNDDGTAFAGLTADQIASLSDYGFTELASDDGDLDLNVDQALAVDASDKITVSAPVGNNAVVDDTPDNLETLTADQITALHDNDGFTAIQFSGDELDLTVDQVLAVANARYAIIKPADATVTVTDGASNLEGLTPGDITLIGAYDPIALISNDDELDLSVAQAVAVSGNSGMTVAAPNDEAVVVLDTGAAIATLTPDQITGLDTQGFNQLTSNSGPLDLSVPQAVAVDNDPNMTVSTSDDDVVAVVDSGSQIETLDDFGSLANDGFTALQSNDGGLSFTVEQAEEIHEAQFTLSVPDGDFVAVTDSAANIADLDPSDIIDLGKDGFEQLNSNAGELDLMVKQAQGAAGVGMTVSAPQDEIAAVKDSADAIEGLSEDDFAALSAAGFTELAANDEGLDFTAETALAIEQVGLKVDAPDYVAVDDSAEAIEDIEADQITALGQDGFTQLDSNNGELDLSVAQAMAVDGDETMTVSAPDGEDVVIEDHADALEDIDADDFGSLAADGFTALLSDDGGLDFSVEQASAIDAVKFTVSAADNNYVSITDDAEQIEGLTPDELADFAEDGFDTLTTDDASLAVQVAEAVAILNHGYVVNVPAGDEKIVSDTPAAIASLSSTEITGLENDGFVIGSGVTINNGSITVDGELIGSGTVNGVLTVDPTGSVEVTSGSFDIATGSVVNNNQISVTGATLDLANGVDLSGTGTVDVTDGSVEVDGSVSSGQTFDIDPSTITIGDPSHFAGTLVLSGGDEIIVDGATGGFYANGAFTFDTQAGDVTIAAPGYSGGDFIFTPDGNTLEIADVAPCYCRGTRILTPEGEVAVEEIAIGDTAVTLSGEAKPIKWIGRRFYDGRFIRGNREVLPIRIAAGALAEGVPVRDLWISPGHALYLDPLLVPAQLLVNGLTITQAETVERVDYFHLEFEEHEIIVAEGAPAESYVESDNRRGFHNADEFAELYPDDDRPACRDCAPRLQPGMHALAAIRARLFARADALGHPMTDDPDLHLVVDGAVVQPASIDGNLYRFTLDRQPGEVALASHSAIPAELEPLSTDTRRLGACIEAIVLYDEHLRVAIDHAHSALAQGFHDDEGPRRWTDGNARLPDAFLHPFNGPFTIEITRLPAQLRYPTNAPEQAEPRPDAGRLLSPRQAAISGKW